MAHSFGEEEVASMRSMRKILYLCLRRGHWELARACLPALHRSPKAGEIEDVVRSLVTAPQLLQCTESLTSQQVAWFWLNALESWLLRPCKRLPFNFQDEPAFLLLLQDLTNQVSQQTMKELYELFLHRWNDTKACRREISAHTVSSLRENLAQDTELIQALLSFLLVDDGHSMEFEYNCHLLNIPVDFILDLLTSLQEHHQTEALFSQTVNLIYKILNIMCFDLNLQASELKHLCTKLFTASWVKEYISEEQVQASILRKQNASLVSLYSSVINEKTKTYVTAQISSGKVSSPELTDAEKAIITFFCETRQSGLWMKVFFYCLCTGKHFLEQILLSALILLKVEDFSTLGELLSNEFKPLRRLLVLLGWTHLQSIESAKSLLLRLHNNTEICNDSILKEFCDGLSFQVEVVEWCIEQNSHCVAKKDLLHYLNSLDSHSGLYILHNLTNLPKLNEEDVFRLFHKGLSSGKNEVSVNQREAHDLAQQRSTVMFQAFCGLKYAMYALCIQANKRAQGRNSNANQMDGSLVDAEFLKEPGRENCLSQVSDPIGLFLQYFTKCGYYLCLLPPRLKLELVENIFSLMFASLNDLAPETPLVDVCSMEEIKKDTGVNVGRPGNLDINIDTEGLVISPFISPQHTSSNLINSNITESFQELPFNTTNNIHCTLWNSAEANYINLKHFTAGLTGFLADEIVLDSFLKMLGEQVELIKNSLHPNGFSLNDEQSLLKGVSAPISSEDFSSRVAKLSKYIFEAQWRYKVVMSNRNAVLESSTSNISVGSDVDCRCVLQQRNNLIPTMLSPPESLLISCILRTNYSEAHQVAQMFNLQSYPSYGELTFMECYQEVIGELSKVEKKIENQSSETAIRKTINSRSTLQAIGNAAAAGMVFYSISDVTDKLVALAESSVPTLQEDLWIRSTCLEKVDLWKTVVEELIPAAMAAFDLACTQAHLWKTCKQLLETSERNLLTSIEAQGRRADIVMEHTEGIKGFQAVLQQINKLMNYPSILQAQTELEEKLSSLFKCSVTEILHTCYSVLQDEYLVCHIILDYELEQILVQLKAVIKSQELKGNIVQSLLDQLGMKPQEVQINPVCKQIILLLENFDKRAHSLNMENYTFDHVHNFFTYIDTLAKVIVQSINSDLESSLDLKMGNPFILLQQKPSQLISYLVFERQVPPERLSMLLKKEKLELNVKQVIVDYCCEALSFSHPRKPNEAQSLASSVQQLMQQSLEMCYPDIYITFSTWTKDSEDIVQNSPNSSTSDYCQYSLTLSALNFLKNKSNATAVLACLSVVKSSKPPKSGLSWMDLRSSRKESPLDIDTISVECDLMLAEFPVFQRYINLMSAPFWEIFPDASSPSSSLCGKPYSALVFLGLHFSSSSVAVIEAFKEALLKKNWTNALQIMNHYTCNIDDLEEVRDALLCCAAAEEMNGWKYIFAVKNSTLRIRLALSFLDKWPLDSCRELLSYCLCETDIEENLKMDLKNKRKEVEVYRKILFLKEDIAWSSRQELKEDCFKDPEAIIQIILKTKDYKLCEDWGLFYPIPKDLFRDVYIDHLLHLLDNKDTERSLQLLKRVDDKNLQLAVIDQALLQDPCIFAIHFLSEYLVLHFKNDLLEMRWWKIRNTYMGSKVLLALPEAAQSTYVHLISSPLLMLEQLLMNMRIDWIATVVQTLKQLVNEPDSIFSTEDVDKLLCIYAGKALDVPFSFREKSDSVNRIPEGNSQSAELETIVSSSQADQLSSTFFVGLPDKGQRRSKPSPEFVPPEKPPTKMQWIPDDTEVTCMVCKNETFTMFNRRHHCRRCGRLVCSSCSMKKMVVEGCRENPARVCDQCHNYFSTNDSKTEEDLEYMEEKPGEGRDLSEVLRLSKAAEFQWCLTLNEAENEVERREFYYEQAPSASLCSAILSLHSKSDECGYQLIERCCLLSKGLTNPEMDSRLLLDIMKNLLFSAKMIFVKVARSHDLALCDSYSSKVDLLKILVTASYQDIPSLHEIVRPAAVVRLRNQLLEAEYYSLAIEVSTKTGLDPSGVWHAWGMACLKSDNLPGAREKFSRCIKAPLDLNHKNVGSKLLEDVIQHLESAAKPILLVKDDDYFATLKELECTLKARCLWYEMMPEGKIQNNTYYQECLYYLHTYGTNLGIIQFYMRHDLMRDALLHLLNKECPGDIFIEGIFVPSYEHGKLHTLETMLESIDPSLESWSAYLIEACKHLQMKNFYNILYEIQQFMKDHVRAAMTCIRFFSYNAKTYNDLGANQKWLAKSKEHLKIYLQEVSRSNRKKSFDTFRKKMSTADISRHINTIELQMEITKFLQRCENLETDQSHNKPPPTLFGHNNMIVDAAFRVILGGKNVEEGFGIAFRVIQDFQLDASLVYSKVCKQLVYRQNYSEILQLVKCVNESGIAAEKDCDQILLRCIEEMSELPSDELEKLIQGMKSDESKIKAFLACRMMRSAYLTAVKQEQEKAIQLVQEVWQVAHNLHDSVVQGICSKWLVEHPPLSQEGQYYTLRK
ncbi:zinc finger FYVE domain-containing protein 26 isoform X1 [Rana temporaria]|uniref:zinc finger FYVE domain-containing protein 26 isoform X1 n=1 Tax=Rana temporaria TaxID=8407 RepID=UPI001AAD20B9|nr:zinc finger FYVE domain-containing protein 26 isoform X1 [Rana temporaria]